MKDITDLENPDKDQNESTGLTTVGGQPVRVENDFHPASLETKKSIYNESVTILEHFNYGRFGNGTLRNKKVKLPIPPIGQISLCEDYFGGVCIFFEVESEETHEKARFRLFPDGRLNIVPSPDSISAAKDVGGVVRGALKSISDALRPTEIDQVVADDVLAALKEESEKQKNIEPLLLGIFDKAEALLDKHDSLELEIEDIGRLTLKFGFGSVSFSNKEGDFMLNIYSGGITSDKHTSRVLEKILEALQKESE
jgi:hypothetical protein